MATKALADISSEQTSAATGDLLFIESGGVPAKITYANLTQSLVSASGTQTLTNKTLTTPTLTTPVINGPVTGDVVQAQAVWEAGTDTTPGMPSAANIAAAIAASEVTDFTGTDGYIQFASGLIMQWGYAADTGTAMRVPYSTSFTTAVFSVQMQMVNNAANYQNTTVATAFGTDLTGFDMLWDSGADGFTWLAIGV